MKKISLFAVLFMTSSWIFAQYKNDNVSYKTVFPQDLCNELSKSNNYLLLDVRSAGEYADTSSSPLYNYGHLQNAVNIDVGEIGKRYKEIEAYKDKPVYVYCSHSQRSRRASKMLADSGFTNIINVNGGITAIRRLPEENCLNNYLVTSVGYKIIAPAVLCNKITKEKDKIFLLDVRTDSAFRHVSLRDDVNGLGIIRNSINIPLADLTNRLAEIPRDKEVIILDLFGDEAAKAAMILHDNKYQQVSMLLEGINRMFYSSSSEIACLKTAYIASVKYTMLSSLDFKAFADKNPGYLALDVRSAEEYANKHKDYWKNIGHLVNAVSIPSDQLAAKMNEIEKYKNKPVLVYAFGTGKEVHEAAKKLVNSGFTNVSILAGGLFNLRWTANNISGNAALSKLVVDIPAENL